MIAVIVALTFAALLHVGQVQSKHDVVDTQRAACERANLPTGSRGSIRFILHLFENLAGTSTPQTQAGLAQIRPQIAARIAGAASRDCAADYPY